jgi:hypothetical protein
MPMIMPMTAVRFSDIGRGDEMAGIIVAIAGEFVIGDETTSEAVGKFASGVDDVVIIAIKGGQFGGRLFPSPRLLAMMPFFVYRYEDGLKRLGCSPITGYETL